MQRLTYSPRKCDQSCSWRHDLRWNAAYYLIQRCTYSPRKCDQSCSWRHDLRWNAAYYLIQRCTYSPRKFDQSCSWRHDFRWNAAYYLMQRCTYSPRKCDQSWWHGDSAWSIESSQMVPFLRTPFFWGPVISQFIFIHFIHMKSPLPCVSLPKQ